MAAWFDNATVDGAIQSLAALQRVIWALNSLERAKLPVNLRVSGGWQRPVDAGCLNNETKNISCMTQDLSFFSAINCFQRESLITV